jgi:hypothetical protein
MAYIINKTDGTKLITLRDGTVDIATTDLALFGKGYAGFGERLNENFVKLLENFASVTPPPLKIKGQLWYDNAQNQIKVWNGSKFKPVGSTTNSSSQPTNGNLGDMWYDTGNEQLHVYNGTAWTLIGPTTIGGSGITLVLAETVEDSAGVEKYILKMIANDTIVGIASADQFTPGTAIAGFATVFKGITLSSTLAGAKFTGTATSSTHVDVTSTTDTSASVIAGGNFLRANANDTTSGTLGVLNDTGLTVGVGSDLTVSITGDNVFLKNITQNGDMRFNINDGGVDTNVLHLDGTNSWVGIRTTTPTSELTVSGTVTATAFTGIVNSSAINVLTGGTIVFEGATADDFETTLTVTDPTADRTITLPNITGTVVTTGDSGTVTSTMLATAAISSIRQMPQSLKAASYVLLASDHGKHISTDSGITVNASVFTIGDRVTIFNSSSGNITITQGTSATLHLVGTATTGNRTLAQKGVAEILCVANDTFVVHGNGIT